MSLTVTIEVHVEELPLTSVTVNTTLLGPTLAHPNEVVFTTKLAIPQASLLPLLAIVALSEALPPTLSCNVRFWQTAFGATASTTVIVDAHVEVFPLMSVTVSTVEFAPILVQLKKLLLKLRLAMPQASLLPLLTAAAVAVPFPLPLRSTVMLRQVATGLTESSTETIPVQVAVFPFTSVTVSTVELDPTLIQAKLPVLKVRVAIPQASELPLLIIAPVTVEVPPLFK